MNDTIETVDYAGHPRFASVVPPWDVDEELVARFTSGYRSLVATGQSSEPNLVEIVEEVFASLRGQSNDDFERCFLDELAADAVSMVQDQIDFYQKTVPARPTTDIMTSRQRDLLERGFYVTAITPRTLGKIRRICEQPLDGLRANAAAGRKSRSDLSVNAGRVIRAVVRQLNRDFRKTGVISSLSAIERQPIRVVGAALELSVPGSTWWKLPTDPKDSPATLYAHVDRSVRAPKSIVYLTDVEHDNGPTTCYPGVYGSLSVTGLQDIVGRCLETVGSSPSSALHGYYKLEGQPLLNERFRTHFMRLPASIRFNSHFGWDILPGSTLEDFVRSRQEEVTGPAGTALVFDGARLLHRGGLLQSGERVVLQVVFERSTPVDRIRRVFAFIQRKFEK